VLTHEKVYPFFISGTGTGADALSKLNNHSYMKPFETGGIVFQMFNKPPPPKNKFLGITDRNFTQV
jgi:hypothetical protein